MALTLAEVEHIARLARLTLTEAEKESYREQLSAILDYAARLGALDTSTSVTLIASGKEAAPLRPDKARPGLSLEDLLRNAPDSLAGQFRIPPVLE